MTNGDTTKKFILKAPSKAQAIDTSTFYSLYLKSYNAFYMDVNGLYCIVSGVTPTNSSGHFGNIRYINTSGETVPITIDSSTTKISDIVS